MTQVCYVKNGGVRATTTPYSARQAISSATMTTANYYDSIYDVHLYNTLDPLDEVLCFNEHDKDYGADTILDCKDGVKYLSVDESNGSIYKAGAHEGTISGIYDFELDSINGSDLYLKGISFSASDSLIVGLGYNSFWQIMDCQLALVGTSANDRIVSNQGQNVIYLKDIDIAFGISGQAFSAYNMSEIIMDNVTPITNTPKFILGSSTGLILKLINSDLTILTENIIDLVTQTNDNIHISIVRCKLNSSATLSPDESTFFKGQVLDAWSISKSDNYDIYHYFEHYYYEGKILESTSQGTRSDGATYDGTNHFSAEFQTNANVVAFTKPLRYKLAELELDLTTSKQLTFHIMMQDGTAPTALNDHECWIDVIYPDLGVTVSSQTHDILETPVDLTLSNKSWDNTTGTLTKQLMTVTVPASISKAPVTVYLHLAKDVTAIGATEFFACPKPEIS